MLLSPSSSPSFSSSRPSLLSPPRRLKMLLPDVFRVIWTLVVVVSCATTHFKNTHAQKVATAAAAGGLDDPSSASSSSSSEFEMRAISLPDGKDGLVVMKPEIFQWPRRRRTPVNSNVIKIEKKFAWENDNIEIACAQPKYFVTWKFTQNQTIQYANNKWSRNHERMLGPVFINHSKTEAEFFITNEGSLQISHLKIQEHDGIFECDTGGRKDKVKFLLEVRKEPNVTYIEGYNGTQLDPNKETFEVNDVVDDNAVDDGVERLVASAQAEDLQLSVDSSSSSSSFSSDSQKHPADSLSSVSSSSSSSKSTQSENHDDVINSKNKRKRKTGLELTLTCTTESAKPPVTHSWFKISRDKTEQLTPVNSKIIKIDEITSVTTTKSTVRLNLSPKDKGAKVECRAYGSAFRNRPQRAVTEPFAIVIPNDDSDTLSAHIVGAVVGFIVIFMLVALFIYMRKYHGGKSHHDSQKETCQADIRPMLLDIEEKKTPEHHAHNAVGPAEANQNHYVSTVGDGILVPPPRSARVDLLYPGSSSATSASSSNSSPAYPPPQLEPPPPNSPTAAAAATSTATTTPPNANGAVGNNVELDAQQPLLGNSSPPSSTLRCPPPPPVHANNNNDISGSPASNGSAAAESDGKTPNTAVVPPKPRARQSKMGVSSLDKNGSISNGNVNANNKPPHVHVVVQDAANSNTNPIPIIELAEYVKTHQLTPEYFENEYNRLPKGQLHAWEAAKKAEHRTKNRFRDMIPYDHSRVHLDIEDQEDPGATDYINASWIGGYDRPKEWIATQGPNKFTINDFWRMCWQVGAVRIVMVTNLVENGKPKCNLYWPEDSCLYGNIHVKMVSSDKLADYTVRTFLVTNAKNHQSREIKQFHFTSWPDHGTPTFPTALLAYYRRVTEYSPPSEVPLPTVVHCSAGVGRTGTFIALDILLKQAIQTGYVDIYGVVNNLREQRINMVQTKEQYVFLHSAVNDALLCGETFIPVVDFTKYHQQLCEETISSGKTKILEQFETLNEVSPVHSESEFRDGNEAANRAKNRYQDILPSDRHRPYLLTTKPDVVNNYINAVFVTGYQNKHGFIATQMPLPNTISDFWCLVWDHRVSSIVMLNDVSLSLTEPSMAHETNNNGIYWPTIKGQPQPFHQFEVELLAEETSGNLTTRTFRLGLPDDQMAPSHHQGHRMIRQFQVNGWPETQSLPSSPVVFVDLLHHVERWQLQAGGGPILAHCLNGQTRTGLYCAASFVVDKIKTEQGVDVFHAVRSIRLSRGGFVENLDHYNFCYEIAQTFLDTFETYSNFDLKSGGAFSSLILDGDDDDVDKVLHLDDLSPPSSPSVDTVVPPKAETFI